MDSALTTGARIAGRYELVAPIADAGITDAWSARDPQGAEVRVSVLGPTSPAQSANLETTWERLRPLSNPGLVSTLELGAADGSFFVVSERFDGRPLANWLEGHRQADTLPSFGVVQRLFDRLAASLLAAHTAGVAHGALSPRCVILKRVGQGHHLRVCDLAVGSFVSAAGTTPSWFGYQAPEQRGPRPDDAPATDVFAAAAILVELLTLSAGPRPDAREPWSHFVHEAKPGALVERLGSLRSDVPRPVWEVIASGLSERPRERGTLQKFQRALRETWTAAGEWDRSGFAEADPPPPDPSRVRARTSMPTAPSADRGANAIEGWQRAERAAVVTQPAAPPRPTPEPIAQVPAPQGFTAPTPAPPPPPAAPALHPGFEVSEATEAIDLAAAERYLQQLHAAASAPPAAQHVPSAPPPEEAFDVRESTRAIDAAAFFEGALDGGASLDDTGGTAVLSQQGGVGAAIAAVDARRDESTRMLDLADPIAAQPSAWGAGPAADPYGRGGAADFGSDDPFASADRGSIPGYSMNTEAWSGAHPTAGAGGASPFVATLKAVPRESIPSAVSAPAPAPTPEKLWGAAPQRPTAPPAPPESTKIPGWQWGVLLAAIVGVAAAMYLALTAR